MSTWMTTAEIAAAKLPGMPTTKRGVAAKAQAEGWDQHPAFARARQGRGGGFEYDVRILPSLARVALIGREITVGLPVVAEEMPAEECAANLSGRAQRERDARLAIVEQFERFAKGLPRLRHVQHLQLFQDKYNLRSLHIEPWVVELVPTISKRSLDRWRAARNAGQTSKLAVDRGQARKGTGVLDQANDGKVRTAILALLAQNPLFSAAHVRDQIESIFGNQLWVPYKGAAPGMTKSVPVPPVRTFQSFIAALKSENRVVLTKLADPDKYRSTMLPAGVGSLRHVNQPNMLWQIDASPIDALCTDGRHSIYACIDIFSRRAILLVSKTPRASAVALLIRKAIMAWGVPAAIKTDNGSDFVARDTQRLFVSLNIEQEISDAYSPQQKGHIERFIRTFQHEFARLLPGFIGHSVADRKVIENRKSFAARLGETEAETFNVQLTGLDVQRLADRWATSVYEQRQHRGLQGLSPAQKWNTANYQPRMVDVRALDLLLMPVAGGSGLRTTTKFGIRVGNYHYATPAIEPGVTVLVRQDPEDLGHVFAFEPDGGRFLGEGTCPELAGVHPGAFLKAVRQLRAEALDEVAKPVRRMMRELAKGPAPIERALQIASEREQTNVVSLPEIAEAHATVQIEAAMEAMGRAPARPDNAAVFQAQLISERVSPASDTTNVRPLRAEETNHQRFQRALEIERRMSAGQLVDERELGWLEGYRTGSEYRSLRMIHDDFGEQASL